VASVIPYAHPRRTSPAPPPPAPPPDRPRAATDLPAPPIRLPRAPLLPRTAVVPPPQRVWPSKRPLCGLLPWCLISRLLGYGLGGAVQVDPVKPMLKAPGRTRLKL